MLGGGFIGGARFLHDAFLWGNVSINKNDLTKVANVMLTGRIQSHLWEAHRGVPPFALCVPSGARICAAHNENVQPGWEVSVCLCRILWLLHIRPCVRVGGVI